MRILVVCTQRLGDVLLATPLLRTLKNRWPQAGIDMLVFADTEGVLAGNTDVDTVIAWPRRTGWKQMLEQVRRLWRRYDIAFAVTPTDRARLYSWLGGRQRAGFAVGGRHDGFQRGLLTHPVGFDDLDTHTVIANLRLAEAFGCAPIRRVVPPALTAEDRQTLWQHVPQLADGRFAVLHPYPQFSYKMWQPSGWNALGRWLEARGLVVALTGGGTAKETDYAQQIAANLARPVNCVGRLSLAEAASLVERAVIYVGPDTVMTHLAAACGAPTVALFGPSNPVKWGPWPVGIDTPPGSRSPWIMRATPWQRAGNVLLLQGEGECVPCRAEGCDRHINSDSRCLMSLPDAIVIAAVEELLSKPVR